MYLQFVRIGALFVVLLVPFFGQANASDRVELCAQCFSASSFAHRAEQSSLAQLPGLTGIDPVYVVNPFSEEVRFFHVHRWQDDDYQPLSAPRSSRGEGEQPRRNLSPRLMQGFFRAEAEELAADSSDVQEIHEGLAAAVAFFQFAESTHLDDLEDLDIDSAVALLGPEDSPAGLRRNQLQNVIANRLSSELSVIRLTLADLAQRVLNQWVGDSDVSLMSSITINFPDGTVIDVEVVQILDGIEGGISFVLEVREESAQGPGLPAVPQSPGQFDGFGFSGNQTTLAELLSLAQLYGIPITGPGGGSGGGCSMQCEISGDEVVCNLSCSAL